MDTQADTLDDSVERCTEGITIHPSQSASKDLVTVAENTRIKFFVGRTGTLEDIINEVRDLLLIITLQFENQEGTL